jgi:CAAX prenyl protease-like protein
MTNEGLMNREYAKPDNGADSGAVRLESPSEPPAKRGPIADLPEILPYLVPIFAYVTLGGVESYLPEVDKQPSPVWYPIAYTVKFALVAAIAWWYRPTWKDFRTFPGAPAFGLAAIIGMVVFVLWVGLDGYYPPLPGGLAHRAAFDPGRLSAGFRWAFIVVRMLGLVVLVPVIEELFWRSFLIRWLIDPDFQRVPIGRVTPMAAVVSSALFALAHPEWLPALLTGLLWAWLLWQTKSLGACVVSHVVANLALGVYVIVSGDYQYW